MMSWGFFFDLSLIALSVVVLSRVEIPWFVIVFLLAATFAHWN